MTLPSSIVSLDKLTMHPRRNARDQQLFQHGWRQIGEHEHPTDVGGGVTPSASAMSDMVATAPDSSLRRQLLALAISFRMCGPTPPVSGAISEGGTVLST